MIDSVVSLNLGGVRLNEGETSEHEGDHESDTDPTQQPALTAGGTLAAGQDVGLLEICRFRAFPRTSNKPLLGSLKFTSGEKEASVSGVFVPLKSLLPPFGVLTCCI